MVVATILGFRYSTQVSQLFVALLFSFLFVAQELTQGAIS